MSNFPAETNFSKCDAVIGMATHNLSIKKERIKEGWMKTILISGEYLPKAFYKFVSWSYILLTSTIFILVHFKKLIF